MQRFVASFTLHHLPHELTKILFHDWKVFNLHKILSEKDKPALLISARSARDFALNICSCMNNSPPCFYVFISCSIWRFSAERGQARCLSNAYKFKIKP